MAMRYLTATRASENSILRPQRQDGFPVVAPDPRPFHREPRCELPGFVGIQLGLKHFRADPAQGQYFAAVDCDGIRATPDENRAEFVLGACRIELRLILEFEQELQRAAYSQ